jgi:hypothetical protein
VCQVASGAKHVVGSAASSLVGFGVGSVLNALGSWVSDGATWLLRQIGSVMATTTTIDLGASWFTTHYEIMAALAGVVIVPILLLGIMQSIYRQNASALIRSVLVNVPLSILLTAVAVKLVQLGLAITDAMSAAIAQGAGLDSGHFLASVAVGLSVTGNGTSAPAFVMFVGGLAVVFGALMVWVELLIRAAAVYVAVLFLPLALASLAWPAISHWCRRLVDTLVALVLGKFVIVAVLSLAAGALAGGTTSAPGGGSGAAATAAPGGGSGPGGSGGGFAAVLGGAALLLFAAFAPWALFRLLPFLEAGAVGHLESVSHRARNRSSAPVKGLAQVAIRATTGSLSGGASGSMGGFLGGSVAGAGAGSGSGSGSGGPGSGSGSGGPGSGSGGPGPAGSSGPSGLGGGVRSSGWVEGAEGGPGGDGPQGTRPDPGPSSAESTGVGTTESPGHGIPAWAVHPQATVTARRSSGGGPAGGPGSPTALRTGHGDAGRLKPLPRQTGALRADSLGRDELGVRLISAPIGPAEPPEARGPDRDTEGTRGP